jgi:hypothetical protein
MKTTHGVVVILAVLLLAGMGCKKSERGVVVAPAREVFGVMVDLPRLDVDFTNASPAVMNSVAVIKSAYRYGRFEQAAAELDKLSNDAGLTPAQQKLVTTLIEQTKQVIAKAPRPSTQ